MRHDITIADDDPHMLFLLQCLVEQEMPQAAISSFYDGEGALRHILANGSDLLITNHHMNRMAGAELIRQVRARGFHFPVIMVSNSPNAEEEGIAAGATEFIDKDEAALKVPEKLRSLLPQEV